MLDLDDILKNFVSVFLGIIIALVLSQECLIQPHVLPV